MAMDMKWAALGVAVLGQAASASPAAAGVGDRVIACRHVADDAARVACYDALTDEMTGKPASEGGEPVVSSWSGNGTMATRPFHVDGPWELQWQSGGDGFFATLFTANGQILDNMIISGKGTSGRSYVPKGGDFYLDMGASSDWTARVVAVPTPPRSHAKTRPPQ